MALEVSSIPGKVNNEKAKKPNKWAMRDDVKRTLTNFEKRMAARRSQEIERDAYVARKNLESDNSDVRKSGRTSAPILPQPVDSISVPSDICRSCSLVQPGRIYEYGYGTVDIPESKSTYYVARRTLIGMGEAFICNSCTDEHYESYVKGKSQWNVVWNWGLFASFISLVVGMFSLDQSAFLFLLGILGLFIFNVLKSVNKEEPLDKKSLLESYAFDLNKQDHITSLPPDWNLHGKRPSDLTGFVMADVREIRSS